MQKKLGYIQILQQKRKNKISKNYEWNSKKRCNGEERWYIKNR